MLPYHTILLDVTHFCSLALAISRSAIKRHIVHAGAVTAYSCNIPSSLSITLFQPLVFPSHCDLFTKKVQATVISFFCQNKLLCTY